MIPSPSAQPLHRGAGDEHAAFEANSRFSPDATGQSAGLGARATGRSPVCMSMNTAGAVVFLGPRRATQRCPNNARLLIAGDAG
jgi:hypothetical protein